LQAARGAGSGFYFEWKGESAMTFDQAYEAFIEVFEPVGDGMRVRKYRLLLSNTAPFLAD